MPCLPSTPPYKKGPASDNRLKQSPEKLSGTKRGSKKWQQMNNMAAAMGTPRNPNAKEPIGLSQERSMTGDAKYADLRNKRFALSKRDGPVRGQSTG